MKHGPSTGQSQSVDRDDEHDNAVEVAIVVQQEHSSPSTFTTTMIEVAVDDNENYNDINYEKINKGLIDPVKLSVNDSIILVAETRSDAEHVKDVEKVIDLLINTIKKEYQERFNYYF